MDRQAATARARRLRNNPTETERVLWERLRQRRLGGLKFRRQVPIGPYILDFVCLRHRFVVEADGPFHDAQQDAARDLWLTARGFRVLRFSNSEIHGSPGGVVDQILGALDQLPPVRKF